MSHISEETNASRPPSGSTKFVNIPQGMNSSMQVKKERKKKLEKKLRAKKEKFFSPRWIRTHEPRAQCMDLQNSELLTDMSLSCRGHVFML